MGLDLSELDADSNHGCALPTPPLSGPYVAPTRRVYPTSWVRRVRGARQRPLLRTRESSESAELVASDPGERNAAHAASSARRVEVGGEFRPERHRNEDDSASLMVGPKWSMIAHARFESNALAEVAE